MLERLLRVQLEAFRAITHGFSSFRPKTHVPKWISAKIAPTSPVVKLTTDAAAATSAMHAHHVVQDWLRQRRFLVYFRLPFVAAAACL